MFYGSDDAKTAVLEIDDDPKRGIAVGVFRTSREMKLLDLTKLPRRLGFFERQPDSSELNRYTVAFLHSFVKSVSAKVESGSREHIDYVPTQVVTEWFRTVFRYGGATLDGIIYPSTQNRGGHSLVLFATKIQCDLEAHLKSKRLLLPKRSRNGWSELSRGSVAEVSSTPGCSHASVSI